MTRRSGELALARIRGIDVAHWDPGRRSTRWGRPTRLPRRVRNFGDLLGPVIVRALVEEWGLPRAERGRRLFAIGSVLHFATAGDVVWGAGLNRKHGTEVAEGLDLRAVRGPRTAELLAASTGGASTGRAPLVGGDPALLLGALRPELRMPPARRRGIVVVPNLNELSAVTDRRGIVNPRWPLERVLRRIASAELVVGSSLHGVVVAESLGVPARFVAASAEHPHKYEDHYLATGRDPGAEIAGSVAEAIDRGGAPAPRWDPRPLLGAFPADLWSASAAPDVEGIARRVEAALSPAATGAHPRDEEVRHG